MRKILLFFAMCMVLQTYGQKQTIYDFETDSTSTSFIYFGSPLEEQTTTIIDNPNSSGINTSSKVCSYVKGIDAEDWAGAFASPQPTLDLTSGGQICVDVHYDHEGVLALKLEQSSTGGTDWITTQSTTTVGEWTTLCFDLDALSIEGDAIPASGQVYGQMVLFFDFGSRGTSEEVTTYFDNISYEPKNNTQVIFDFETEASQTDFTYFGGNIDGDFAKTIGNPNPTGVNVSDSVIAYIKPAGAMDWAGAFAAPQPTIDLTSGGEICVDLHYDHIGSLSIKLEQSTSGGADWITTVPNTVANEWETVCFPVNVPSEEDANSIAAGQVYGQIVIFADFGIVGGATDVTSYFDNFVYKPGAAPSASMVTLSVNMADYSDPFTTVYLSGGFNSWSDVANPMSDDDGDGIWTTTVEMDAGAQEYKFQVDAFAAEENLMPSDVCTVTFDDGNGGVFTNRVISVGGDMEVDAVCWESCYNCGDEVNITWNLNTETIAGEISPDGIYVAGGPFFGHGDLPAMTDDDGDGVYTLTIRRERGFTSDYTFINGICLPDWDCKEVIAGQDCAVAPFNDRNLAPAMDDVVINTCFGQCTTDGSCGAPPESFSATFRVDMSGESIGADGIFLSGFLINGWSPDETPMTDMGNNIYEATVELTAGDVEYKFVNSGTFEDVMLDDCTIQAGNFVNRLLVMQARDTVLPAFQWASCNSTSTNTVDYDFDANLFIAKPSVSNTTVTLEWSGTDERVISMTNLSGQQVINKALKGTDRLTLDVADLPTGMYNIHMTVGSTVGVQKIVVY